MTIDPDYSGIAVGQIVWKQQSAALWTGRDGDRPAGTIEHGSSYTFVDLDGTRHMGFRALEDAQRAAANASESGIASRRVGRIITIVVLVAVIVTCAVVAIAVVTTVRG